MPVETRYTKSGDVHIAYQVSGSGPLDLVYVPGFVSHLEADWESPAKTRILERLGRSCRLIRFDKRGTGLSDRGAAIPSLEQRMDSVFNPPPEFTGTPNYERRPSSARKTVVP